jgi:diguanylate cyclase (GGDEF)-like protein/PAS domain S-box-containing protein
MSWNEKLLSLRKPSAHAYIAFFVIAACVLAVGLESWPTWRGRTVAIRQDKIETANLARSLAQHAHDMVQTADAVLIGLSERVETEGFQHIDADRLHRIMALYVQRLPMLHSLAIYDATGRRVVDSLTASPAADLNNSDRAYFRYHLTHPGGELHVEKPIRSKTDGQWILPVSRRIDNPDGSFDGVVLATISIDFLQQFYKTFDPTPGGAIGLSTSDGILIARNPSDDKTVGLDLSKGLLFRRISATFTSGTFQYRSGIDGIDRFGTVHRVQEYPLLVLVSHSVTEVLAGWWSDALRYLTIGCIAAASLIFLGSRVSHLVAVREETDRRYRLLADYSSDVIVSATVSGKRLYASPSFSTLTGWSPEESLTLPLGSITHPDDQADLQAAMAALRPDSGQMTSIFRYIRKDGLPVWVEARVQMMPTAEGAEAQFIANIRDISKRKAAEDEVTKLNQELAALAMTDGLTGLSNRRSFDQALQTEWSRAIRTGSSLSVLMIDVDRFKLYNDGYGHQQGDACLRAVAAAVAGIARRPGEMAARYGGEEIVLLLPETTEDGAREIGERARAAIQATAIEHRDNQPWGCVTASIGTATLKPRLNRALQETDLVAIADQALYQAKHGGRNQVVVSDRQPPTAPTVAGEHAA